MTPPKGALATGKLLFGSTAQRILLEADCPVLGVKVGDASRSTGE